jgi:hypothetical protein
MSSNLMCLMAVDQEVFGYNKLDKNKMLQIGESSSCQQVANPSSPT